MAAYSRWLLKRSGRKSHLFSEFQNGGSEPPRSQHDHTLSLSFYLFIFSCFGFITGYFELKNAMCAIVLHFIQLIFI